jgi:hypothetical protein
VQALSRSWNLTKVSFRVIGQDKELLLFPLIAMVLSVGYLLALLYPTIWLEMSRDVLEHVHRLHREDPLRRRQRDVR